VSTTFLDQRALDSLANTADKPAHDALDTLVTRIVTGKDPGNNLPPDELDWATRHDAFPNVITTIMDPEDDAVNTFLNGGDQLDDHHIDRDLVRHAQRFFEDNGIAIITALFHAALPEAYLGKRGVQVLGMTGEFVNNWTRRIQLTGQLLVNVLSPDPDLDHTDLTTLHAGQVAARAVRRVRLRHAAVRWLLNSEYKREPFEKAFVEGVDAMNESLDEHGHNARISVWNVRMHEIDEEEPASQPLNQEDLLGTLGTFTSVTFDALAKMGIPFTDDDRIAYHHLWNVVGWHLGIGDADSLGAVDLGTSPPDRWPHNEILPLDPNEMDAVFARIRKKLGGSSEDGVRLTKTLVQEMSRPLPGPLQGAPAFLVRYFIGDDAADKLDVDTGGYTQLLLSRTGLLAQLAKRTRVNPFGQVVVSALSSAITRYALRAYITQTQGVDPGFTIDPGIANRWGIQTGPQISAPITR
jgi:hypothetical protein